VARIKAPDEPTGFGGGRGCESNAHGIGISPDQKTLWVNSRPSNSVFAYSLPDIKLLGHVSLPEQVVRESQAGQETLPGSHLLLTARQFTFPAVG
jgi:hypothetical protein